MQYQNAAMPDTVVFTQVPVSGNQFVYPSTNNSDNQAAPTPPPAYISPPAEAPSQEQQPPRDSPPRGRSKACKIVTVLLVVGVIAAIGAGSSLLKIRDGDEKAAGSKNNGGIRSRKDGQLLREETTGSELNKPGFEVGGYQMIEDTNNAHVFIVSKTISRSDEIGTADGLTFYYKDGGSRSELQRSMMSVLWAWLFGDDNNKYSFVMKGSKTEWRLEHSQVCQGAAFLGRCELARFYYKDMLRLTVFTDVWFNSITLQSSDNTTTATLMYRMDFSWVATKESNTNPFEGVPMEMFIMTMSTFFREISWSKKATAIDMPASVTLEKNLVYTSEFWRSQIARFSLDFNALSLYDLRGNLMAVLADIYRSAPLHEDPPRAGRSYRAFQYMDAARFVAGKLPLIVEYDQNVIVIKGIPQNKKEAANPSLVKDEIKSYAVSYGVTDWLDAQNKTFHGQTHGRFANPTIENADAEVSADMIWNDAPNSASKDNFNVVNFFDTKNSSVPKQLVLLMTKFLNLNHVQKIVHRNDL